MPPDQSAAQSRPPATAGAAVAPAFDWVPVHRGWGRRRRATEQAENRDDEPR